MSEFLGNPLQDYLDKLASKAPTPGGGSVAALVGALAAALLSMVANFTVGKEKFREVEPEVSEILASVEALRGELSELTEEDSRAYGKISAAYKLPKKTQEEKAVRSQAIQSALKEAAQVPLKASIACHRVLELSRSLVDKGNPNLISDVGVAAVLAEAAFRSAALNVDMNAASIKDEQFVQGMAKELEPLAAEVPAISQEVWDKVVERISGS